LIELNKVQIKFSDRRRLSGGKMTPRIIVLAFAFAAPLVLAIPASAQWRYYDGYRPYPPDSAYPPYPGGTPDYEPQSEPRGNYGYGGPEQQPNSDQQTYAAPGPITPGEPISGGARDDAQAAASQRTAQIIENPTSEPPGTIVVDTRSRHLFYVQKGGTAIEYGIGVGRQGFAWKGTAYVGRKAEWPRWIPPKEMIARRPDLPSEMSGGLANPLGARALYLFKNKKDTLFRIHGTNEPNTIGQAVSSGCIRMMNADVMDLYRRVPVGARVVVL
jgi:lipoprotein-anchoring transpeptidase ErfK/SrfK